MRGEMESGARAALFLCLASLYPGVRLDGVADDGKNGKGQGGVLKDLVQAESMMQLALTLPVACFLGWGLGALLDKHFHTGWIQIVGLMLGAVAGFLQIFRTAQRFMGKGGR
jgi:ATP synthase protein I